MGTPHAPMRQLRTATLLLLFCAVCVACRGADAQPATWHAEEWAAEGAGPAGRRNAFLGYDPAHDVAILYGGMARNADGVRVSLADTWLFFVNETRWEEVPTAVAPPARHAGVSGFDDVRGRFLVATGETRHADGRPRDFWNDVWAFDVATRTWTELPTTGRGPTLRYGSAGGVYTCPPWSDAAAAPLCTPGETLLVSHGFKSKRYHDTYALDLATLEWRDVTPSAGAWNLAVPRRRCLVAGALRAPETMVIFGGCASGEGPCPLRDTWEFEGDAWSNMGSSIVPFLQGRPDGRQHPILASFVTEPLEAGAAVTDAHVGTLMFGGDTGSKKLGDLAVLPAGASEWREVTLDESSDAAMVGARTAAMLVATRLDGTFLLFGGEDSAGALPGNTVAIHAPPAHDLAETYSSYRPGAVGAFVFAILVPFLVSLAWLLVQWARTHAGGRAGSWAQAAHTRLALRRGVGSMSAGELVAVLMYALHVTLFMAAYGADAESEAFARAVGIGCAINLAYLIIPVTRHSFLVHVFGTSLERALRFHRVLARVTLLCITMHLAAMLATFGGKVFTVSKFVNVPLFGIVAWVLMVIMGVAAYEPVRRKHFEWFYPYTHSLYTVATVLVIMHSVQAALAMLLPLLLLLVDQVGRLWRSRASQWHVRHAEVLGEGRARVTRLEIASAGTPMHYEAGQFVFIAVHALSRVHFHPFSISCAPGLASTGGTASSSNVFTLHIKDMGEGTFTHSLAEHVRAGGDVGRVGIEGPHGRLTVPLFGNDAPDAALFVAGGIGITPMVAMWQALCQSTRSRPRAATLVWTVRTMAEAELFLTTLRNATSGAVGSRTLRVLVHVTREKGGADEGASAGTGVQVVAGSRPDVAQVLQTLRSDAGEADTTSVLACGPPPMVSTAEKTARAAGPGVFFHKEVFLF